MKSKCELVRNGEVRHKGKPADEITIKNKVAYSCYGYIDAMTDEPLDACKRCEIWFKKHW